MKSLKSKKFVTEVFCWNWYYYTVTKEGVKFLSQYLGIWIKFKFLGVSENVLPKIFKRTEKKVEEEGEGREGREGREERRGGYGQVS